jgi:hypothetical protein
MRTTLSVIVAITPALRAYASVAASWICIGAYLAWGVG